MFLGISDRLSELCCTLEILSYLKNYANGWGQYKSLKTSFPVSSWTEREESSPMFTHSLWCRLATLHSRCCGELYLETKTRRIGEVVKAVGFSLETWGGTVVFSLDFVAYMFTSSCSHRQASVSFLTMLLMQEMGFAVACLLIFLTWNSWDVIFLYCNVCCQQRWH